MKTKKIKSIIVLGFCIILPMLSELAIACCPSCNPCQVCEGGVCVKASWADCDDDGDCNEVGEDCKSCNTDTEEDCYCYNDQTKCGSGKVCCDGKCEECCCTQEKKYAGAEKTGLSSVISVKAEIKTRYGKLCCEDHEGTSETFSAAFVNASQSSKAWSQTGFSKYSKTEGDETIYLQKA